MITLSTIKSWFVTDAKPTQSQFWDTWDSFWHKEQKIPLASIDGVDELFAPINNHFNDDNAHAEKFAIERAEIEAELLQKADLIDGKIPVTQIPVVAFPVTPDASETQGGLVNTATQKFKGNKEFIGESDLVGNVVTFKNSSNQTVAEISNLGDSYFNEVRIGKGKGAGANNTVLGKLALDNNTTGNFNTAVGLGALNKNTTGGKNTAIGGTPLYNNTIGESNTAIGYYSMYSNISGSFNLSIGDRSLYSNTAGFENTAIGYFAMYSNTTGGENIGIGSSALQSNTTGLKNIGIGLNALHSKTTGSKNIGIGEKSGRFIADGTTNNSISNNSIYIGSNTKALANNQTNQIVIGYDATGAGSNTATIGNTSIVKTVLRGVIAHSTSYTVATLPTGALGDTAFVTDAVAPTYLGALTGGGSVACPVFHNGTNWVSH